MKDIGTRAAKEIMNRVSSERSLTEVLEEIEMTRAHLCQWTNYHHTPGGKVLRRIALAGYDIHYILTGERK